MRKSRMIVTAIAAGILWCAAGQSAQAAQGTVKWFNGEKGYGFITPDGAAATGRR